MRPSVPGWDGQRETLEDLSQAVHYNRWIHGLMEPFLGRRILEIGCGTGNMTLRLAEKARVLAMDIQEDYLEAARRNLRGVRGIRIANLSRPGGKALQKAFRPDTLVYVNILEHLQDDGSVLREGWKLLPRGGKVLVFVPALPWLYGSMDRTYGHHRRYTLRGLEGLLGRSGFRVLSSRYLNLLGILGWWLNGKVLKRAIVPKGQMLLYDQVVRFVGRFERFLPRPIGLSIFCAAVKES